MSLLLALLFQGPGMVERIDLTKLGQPDCPAAEADEIVVCKKHDDDEPYRIKPLKAPDGAKRVAGPGLGLQLSPSARANAYGESVEVPGGGGMSNRAMVRLTIDF